VIDGPELADLEADLRRRLADMAATTTLEPEAWDAIERRATVRRTWTAAGRFGPTRRKVVALAAAVAVVVSVIALSRDGDSHTETVDQSSTSTTDQPTSSTTDPHGTSTTTTTGAASQLPPNAAPRGGAGAVGEAGPDGAGPSPEGGSSGAPGATGSPPSSGQTSPPDGTPPDATPPAATPPDGHPVVASIGQSGYTVNITAFESGGTYYMNLWRDRSYYLGMWGWAMRPGQNCLAGEGSDYSEGELATLKWGFVRSDAARVRIVTTSGNASTAIVGSEVAPGVRAWIGERPAGQVDRFEALDADGSVLHTATTPVWDAAPDTC
jgi:hypothetical protein